jgi:very-short-patch-repair endonuclease
MDSLSEPVAIDLPSALKSKLETGRIELLDLSSRNRLINVPRKSKAAKTIEVIDGLSPEVYRLLVSEAKAFTFLPSRRKGGSESTDADDGDELNASDIAQPEDDHVSENSLASRHSDTRLQTRLTSEGLQKRLLTLHYDAKTIQEEQGVNILFLAIGMLKWFEDANSDIERHAPLILVPVTLERGTAAEKFKLRWLHEDPAMNLSLETLLMRQHGIKLPKFVEGDDHDAFSPAEYVDRVAAAVSGQARWEVLRDDMVLGFFSFAKFLMYRDLDPELWPAGAGLSEHPVVGALLGDGFPASEPLFGDNEPLDPRIGPEALTHIVDADGSQTEAIYETRGGRHLVIQGPPGTGKSQTIANVIAGAVADGKRVLFVAEKMAALEVVKSRLDRVGVGDICLELHSNKTNKRAILEEIKRTWELGKPNGSSDANLLRQLGQTRETLNAHPIRFHTRHEPSGFTPYQTTGHLVRLRAATQPPARTKLVAPETWDRPAVEARKAMLTALAGRIQDIGLPSRHPWRGVRLPSILPTQRERVVDRIRTLAVEVEGMVTAIQSLEGRLNHVLGDSLDAVERLLAVGRRVAKAPSLATDCFTSPCWTSRSADLDGLLEAGELHTKTRQELSGVLADAAWDTDVKIARQNIAAYGAGWFRWLNGDYKKANALLRSILAKPAPGTLAERIKLLDQLIAAQKAAVELAREEALAREAFGDSWRRERSEWSTLRNIVDWMRGNDTSLAKDICRISAALTDRTGVGELCEDIDRRKLKVKKDLDGLMADLQLDLGVAFGTPNLVDVSLEEVSDRLALWIARQEDLPKWISFSALADESRKAGLGDMVDRISDGNIDALGVIPEFEMAYFEAILEDMAAADPEIARFDGDGHSRLVSNFRDLDQKRIQLARLEVAAAHHRGMPSMGAGAGPIGILRGEFARKRGHMAIRTLMERAGLAVQAIKPVFMMSPLSVAQFLKPGAVQFDVLVIDEASQIQPVDALGAIARCKQIVIVGDQRQLPPTRFFDKMMTDDDRDDDGVAGIADVESILGLCVSKGLPERMLRWHYRSRHQSLIAVSNSQFYENKLFIVPSPYTQQAGMGLRFTPVPNGVFDSGKSATNPEEAKVVAAAVIRHARDHADLSLGVAAFSTTQRRAILDEVERLRRLNPETEGFFTKHAAESFFVKNLENIQGDERDVIFISVGYGRNAQGYMSMNFGPLNRDGGERRLNVLISRAKRRCEVFSSITDDDIDLERAKGKGVVAFKLFLHYARTGKLSVGLRTGREPDSVFEEQVASALRAHGYDVHPQVGLAGFFIDIAVADFELPGRYILGIECDGAPYHSSRSARDRDRLRQAVLEDHGWTIHRIWSSDWFHRPQEQLARTIAAIEAAKADLAARDDASATRAVPVEIVTVERGDVIEVSLATTDDSPARIPAYVEAKIAVPLHQEVHEVASGVMVDIVRQIVEIEGPIHMSEIIARVRMQWGLKKAGSRIHDVVERALRVARQTGQVTESRNFFRVPSTLPQLRNRENVVSPSLKKPEYLPPEELIAGAVAFVTLNLGATVDELVQGLSRQLGFKATSAQLRQILENAVGEAAVEGPLRREGDLLRLSA